MNDYSSFDALGLAELIRTKQVTAAEVLEEAIGAAEQVNPEINAIVTRLYESARREAEGSLSGVFGGVPFLLKDIHAQFANVPMSHGCRLLRRYRPAVDSEIVERYRRGGLIVFGKTNTSEFGILPVTEPALFGPTRNPWNGRRTAGGSSGGAAAAVAAGIVAMAHGTDGGGSLRIPASCCGVFGFKPSRGVVPTGPLVSDLFFGYGTQHVISRSVRDSAAALDLIAGPDIATFFPAGPYSAAIERPPSRLRIALGSSPFVPATVHPDCIAAVEKAGRSCEALGHIVERGAPAIDPDEFAEDYFTMVCAGALSAVSEWSRHFGRAIVRPDIELTTDLCRTIGDHSSPADVVSARDRLMGVQRQMEEFFTHHDVMLTPTLGSPPLQIGAFRPSGGSRAGLIFLLSWPARGFLRSEWARSMISDFVTAPIFAFTPFAALANVAGLPSMSVPMAVDSSGLPLGLMFTAAMGRDSVLLALAAELESSAMWVSPRPEPWAA